MSIPLTLYIHTPWCIQKCPYCDFNSHTLKTDLPEKAYIDALIADFEQLLPQVAERDIETIFIGGGTPSLFSANSFTKLFSAIQQHIKIASAAEITLEANPGTFEQTKFKAYRDIGINRLSLGIQSCQDDKLRALGRIHTAEEALNAVVQAQAAGFNNINCDLMFGLPEQTVADSLSDLEKIIALKPAHISWYQLTLEPNTAFAHRPPLLPNDDMIWQMQVAGQALLKKHGFNQYEISAYAKNGFQCQHNLNYWRFGDYLGIGAGSHSKITRQSKVTRYWKIKHPKAYLQAQPSFISGQKILKSEELPLEFMLNQLRLYESVSFEHFEKTTGLERKVIKKPLLLAQQQGLVNVSDSSIKTTTLGKQFLNDLLSYFMPK